MKVEKFNNPLIFLLPAGEPVAKIWQLKFIFENLVNKGHSFHFTKIL